MKMHPSHRPCLLALPARSRSYDVRGNVTHTGNLGSVPKVSIPKCRIILGEQANIMQIACAVAGSVPKFSNVVERSRYNEMCIIERGSCR